VTCSPSGEVDQQRLRSNALQRIALCSTLCVREILWTEQSEAHIARHCVQPVEVEEVVFSRPQWSVPQPRDIELLYGRTLAGRYLLVVLSDGLDGRWYVVTAREMTHRERRTFRRKRR
jgi:hypothetical protein